MTEDKPDLRDLLKPRLQPGELTMAEAAVLAHNYDQHRQYDRGAHGPYCPYWPPEYEIPCPHEPAQTWELPDGSSYWGSEREKNAMIDMMHMKEK